MKKNLRVVRIGGAERELRYSAEAIRRYEVMSGKSVLMSTNTEIQITDIMNLLWAGLLWNNPRLTIQGIEAWIDEVMAEGVAPTDYLENILYTLADDGWYGKAGDKIKKVLDGDKEESDPPVTSTIN